MRKRKEGVGGRKQRRTGIAAWITGAVGLILLGAIGIPAPVGAQDGVRGTWSARQADDGRIRIQLRLDAERDDWGQSLPEEHARAVAVAAAAADGIVDWTLQAPAGTVVLRGRLNEERGLGEMTFQPTPDFPARMSALGLAGRIDVEESLAAALYHIDEADVRELRSLDLQVDEFSDLIAAAIFGIDRPFVDGLREVGVDGDLQDFLAFSIHGVTPAYVGEVSGWDLGRLGPDDLLAFRIHGVTPAWIRDLQSAGVDARDADDLVAARIHGVTPDFARTVVDWGWSEADFEDLVSMRIHGVTAEWLSRMSEVGMRPSSIDRAVAFRIHGVDPELVTELREMGYDDLDGDDLLRIRIHGLDRILRGRRGGG